MAPLPTCMKFLSGAFVFLVYIMFSQTCLLLFCVYRMRKKKEDIYNCRKSRLLCRSKVPHLRFRKTRVVSPVPLGSSLQRYGIPNRLFLFYIEDAVNEKYRLSPLFFMNFFLRRAIQYGVSLSVSISVDRRALPRSTSYHGIVVFTFFRSHHTITI